MLMALRLGGIWFQGCINVQRAGREVMHRCHATDLALIPREEALWQLQPLGELEFRMVRNSAGPLISLVKTASAHFCRSPVKCVCVCVFVFVARAKWKRYS